MKPEQKFMLSCRQTGKAAARLIDWLEHNPILLGTGHASVCEDIGSLAAELSPLAAAAESHPGIALISTSPNAKSELLFQLLAIKAQTTVGELGQRPMDAATIKALLPSGDEASSCAILRFSDAELPPAPRGFPIHVGLLSITDIVTIIAGASISSAHPAVPLPPEDEIAALFGELASRLSPQALPGLSEREVLDLRDHLNARWPGNPTLQSLTAARYWDQFREIAAHLTERDRRRVLALLWRNDAPFTNLLDRLCDGLDKLGQGADGYCPVEALLGKDKASGWLTSHPRSIIDGATLRYLDQPHGPALAMMNRYGQTVDVERPVVAALISELTLHLSATRLNELAPADLLDFPTPPSIASSAPPASHGQSADDGLSIAIANFARMKAIHLFERGCHRRDVTALVIVIDPAQEDDTYAQAIGDWVESTQGPNAHARERVRRGLFVAAMDQPQQPPFPIAANEARVQSIIREIIGGEQEWPVAWTPNRPMNEVFWFTPDDTMNPAVMGNPLSSSMVLAPFTPAAPGSSQRTQSGPTQLVPAVALASNPRAKQLQLNQSLQERRRRIRQTVLRHHTSNDPSALSMWRRSTAVVVQDRLQFIIDQHRLGLLHRALIPTEEDLIVAIRIAENLEASRSAGSANAARWRDATNNDDQRSAFDTAAQSTTVRAGRMASIALAHWFKAMRRASRSQRLCRDLRIEMGVMHHLVDELQIGALRCGLSSEIANAYLQSAAPAARDAPPGGAQQLSSAERDLVRLTAYACRIITAYLEVLGSVPGRGHNTHARASRASAYDLEVAGGAPSGYASLSARPMVGGRRNARPSLAQWEVSFVSLVEDNIASAHMVAGRGDKDRELGELIQLFASGPFEVEP
ncbi:MAG: virulence factor SrfC family protein [Hyphomicrobiaceae bacterium]